ncbi:disks large homolog 5-like [Rattus norvegicus]
MKRLENLKIALHKMQKERDELRRILADYPGKNLNDRNKFESEMLMMQHEEVMTDMKKMSEQINTALVKCKNLTLENDWYW